MSTAMIYYLAWQEDDWLDEILDRFPQVHALVPNAKTFQLMQEQRDTGEVERGVIVLNAAHEQKTCREFLQRIETDQRLAADPLYIVGLKPEEEEEWKAAYPQANIVVITGFAVEFDYDSVLDQMAADMEGAR
jgi:hypothetical protein